METVYLLIPLVCLAAAVVVGLAGHWTGRRTGHSITIGAVAVAFALSVVVAVDVAGVISLMGRYISGLSAMVFSLRSAS